MKPHLNQTELAETLQVIDYSLMKRTNELEFGAFCAIVQATIVVPASWSNNDELVVTTLFKA